MLLGAALCGVGTAICVCRHCCGYGEMDRGRLAEVASSIDYDYDHDYDDDDGFDGYGCDAFDRDAEDLLALQLARQRRLASLRAGIGGGAARCHSGGGVAPVRLADLADRARR